MAEGLSVALPLAVNTTDGAYALNKDLESMANQNLKMVILTKAVFHMLRKKVLRQT